MKRTDHVKYPLRHQFSLLFLALLAGMIVISLVLNDTLLEQYYVHNKTKVMNAAYKSINDAANSGDISSEGFDIELRKICEKYNIDVIVLDADSQTVKSSSNDSSFLAKRLWDNLLQMGAGASSGDDTQMTYTKDELKKAISEKESQIRNLKLDQKEEELKVKNTQKSLDSQTVKATISGVVKKVGNAENPSNDGSAFIQVSGNEGLYVRGYLSETYLDQVKVGDELNVTSWSSGAFAAATVTEISPYPTTSYMSYSETPASFYPFTAVIPEGGEGFENGDWIEIAITVGNDVENGNGLYVSKEFIREENGQKFVYIRDENDKLKKQNVVTGKLLWGSYYEVKSGLSEEDYIAFPYGKTVVEGADTKESSSSDYYNS